MYFLSTYNVHRKRNWQIIIFVVKLGAFIARSVSAKISSSLRDPRSEAGAYAKSRAYVSERKHIKDGVLLKEERKGGGGRVGGKKQMGESKPLLFPRSSMRALCVHTFSSELRAMPNVNAMPFLRERRFSSYEKSIRARDMYPGLGTYVS